jgi:hypothetical protein
MAEQHDELVQWNGRELFDASAQLIGTVAGFAYPRARFGTMWLLVTTATAKNLVVPVDHIKPSGDRLVLPYPKTHVEAGPSVEADQLLSKADERRLRLHYGFDFGMRGSTCNVGCGLCRARRRAERAR